MNSGPLVDKRRAITALSLNTLAFTVCFAVWMMNGVLVTFLVDNKIYDWDKAQIAWLIGIPVLTGSLVRLPVGVLTDRFGGKPVYAGLMLLAAVPTWFLSKADGYTSFLLLSLGFGLTGAAFAVGIAFTSVWFPKERQGLALGIFGAGNAGAALTSIGAPHLLRSLTHGGTDLEGWRRMPQIYATLLVAMAIVFWLLSRNKVVDGGQTRTLAQRLAPLRNLTVWRFGLDYFFVFGGFVALAQWLIPYYVSAYGMTIAAAGLMASIFSLPSGVIRALGGWLSDAFSARKVMYWVLGFSVACCALLCVPRMDVQSPGEGVIALRKGKVEAVTGDSVTVAGVTHALTPKPAAFANLENDHETFVFPAFHTWQEPMVQVGDAVARKQLLARGVTHIYFQANVWIFTGLVFVLGIAMGIGKAAVYRQIPDAFPRDVGVVGGIVGVIGGLGGFVCPILFGYLLRGTGIWTTTWFFFLLNAVVCVLWMRRASRKRELARAPVTAVVAPHVAAVNGTPQLQPAPVAGGVA